MAQKATICCMCNIEFAGRGEYAALDEVYKMFEKEYDLEEGAVLKLMEIKILHRRAKVWQKFSWRGQKSAKVFPPARQPASQRASQPHLRGTVGNSGIGK